MSKQISISAKCSDLFNAALNDDKLGRVGEYEGYVPRWFPNPNIQHFGDYVELRIDVETGRILNWKKPTDAQLKETFKV